MGFFRWLFNLLFNRPGSLTPQTEETVNDVADRLDRFADRYQNAGDYPAEQAARQAAVAARRCFSVADALRIEREYLAQADGLQPPVGSVAKPRVGYSSGSTGARYVVYGRTARVGGSRSWRNNNPGYIRCSDRAVALGAIGCDGEYAIFPDVETGLDALLQWLPQQYPSKSFDDALRQQMPPEAGADAADQIIEKTGIDPQSSVQDLTEDQLQTIAEAVQSESDWSPGESYESGGPAPDWLGDLWSAPATAEPPAAATAEAPAHSDDS